MIKDEELVLFSLYASKDFGEAVATHLGLPLAAHEEREFEDGEHKTRPLVSVRGKDVFVIQSLYGDLQESVNDKLCRLLFFLGALKDASAGRVTAVLPYLCYARKDRKSKARDPVTTRYVASLFEAVGVNHILALDVHNLAAFQNAWRIETDHLEAKTLFVEFFKQLTIRNEVVVVSPDAGGIKRAEELRLALSRGMPVPVSAAFMEKYRSRGEVTGGALVGDVANKTAIIVDDLISSGTTIARAAKACQERGSVAVYAAATHGVFSSKADEALAHPAVTKVVVTNTVPPFRIGSKLVRDKLVVLDAAPLFAEAVRRIHSGDSIVDLLGME